MVDKDSVCASCEYEHSLSDIPPCSECNIRIVPSGVNHFTLKKGITPVPPQKQEQQATDPPPKRPRTAQREEETEQEDADVTSKADEIAGAIIASYYITKEERYTDKLIEDSKQFSDNLRKDRQRHNQKMEKIFTVYCIVLIVLLILVWFFKAGGLHVIQRMVRKRLDR